MGIRIWARHILDGRARGWYVAVVCLIAVSMAGAPGIGAGARAGAAVHGDAASQVSAAAPGEMPFNVTGDGASFATSLPPSSVATYVWTPGGQTVQEWRTTSNGSQLGEKLAPQPAVQLNSGLDSAAVTVKVGFGSPKQTMRGFGGAMTDSAATLIESLPASQRQALMNELFGPSGARLNVVRVPIGASDLIDPSDVYNSYQDSPSTPFNIAHATKYLLPALAQAKLAQPGLQLIATPWSAPGWMKTSGSFHGASCSTDPNGNNTLRSSDYNAYARYLVKFVQAVEAYKGPGNQPANLPVNFVSLQNEPENCNPGYPTMNLTEPDEVMLAGDLRTALNNARLTATGILGFDHNWYNGSAVDSYPSRLARDAGSNVAAIGYHCYGNDDNPNAFGYQLAETTPEVMMTECTGSGPDQPGDIAQNLVFEVREVLLGPIRNWATTSLYFSLAEDPLNSAGQNMHVGGCGNCRGMVTVYPGGTFAPSQDYYYWAQFSKFADPGATVIGSSDLGLGSIETVAFRNPDGSIVLVALNSAIPPAYTGHIVQWNKDNKAQKTAWLVGPDGHRRWISNISTYNCLKAGGAPGPDQLDWFQLDQLADLTNVWAVCGADRIGVNSMLQNGFYARSQNGAYTLRLTGSNLTLADAAGDVIWSTGRGADDLVLQSDGNLVEYSAGAPVWASNTVGSGAAWLVVNNDGTLDLYNSAGSKVWTSVSAAAYVGHIVEWVNGGGKPNTSWIVSSDGKRYWIPDTSTYYCMVNTGFSDLGPQPSGVLNALPDSGQWAHCPVSPRGAPDTLSPGQGLYQGQSITSANGDYTLILQQDHNLVLYGPSGALWATNIWTGGFVIMQTDGNFVGYTMWDSPTWATGTGGDGGNCDLVVQNDSNLVLYCGGVAKWDRFHGRL